MHVIDSLNLNSSQRRTHDAELLTRLLAFPSPLSLPTLFGQKWTPRWAQDAADRLELAGFVKEVEGGKIEVTDAGRAALRPKAA